MHRSKTPLPEAYIPSAVLLIIIGVGGLLILMNFTTPMLGFRWLFFFLIVVGLTGFALPATAFLNFRFRSKPPAGISVVFRQALWVGIYGSTLAWLQFGDVFSINLALIMFVGFVAIEFLLRIREQSRWKP